MQRQQVHQRTEWTRQLRELVRLCERIVLPADQHVLERHPAAELRQRLDHVGQRVFLFDRHQLMPQLGRRRMQRQGEPELLGALSELGEARQDPDGGHGDVPGSDAEPVRMVEDCERRVHGVPVEERLAHSHEDDVGGHRAGVAQDQLAYLTGDLARPQVAPETHPTRGTEHAPQRAPDLRRDAQRAALSLGDQHRLDGLAVGELPEELLGPVARQLGRDERKATERERLGELAAQRRRQVGRLLPGPGRTLPQPRHYLCHPVAWFGVPRQPVGERGLRRVGRE